MPAESPTPPARLFWTLLTAGLVALCAVRARMDFVFPNDLPSGDVGYYTTQAMDMRDLLLSGDWAGLADRALQPELHPFGHPLSLAAWMAVAGDHQDVVRLYGLFCYLLAFAGLVLLARRIGGPRATNAGLIAVALMALSTFLLAHLFTAMTEPTSMLVWLAALMLGVHFADARGPWPHLALGTALLAATLVRYNLFPMLLLPLVLHGVVQRVRHGAGPGAWGLLWAVPTALFVGGWVLSRPEAGTAIASFMVNRPGELDFWTVDNLLWVPLSLSDLFAGTPLLAWPVFALFALGLVPTLSGREHRWNLGTAKARLELVLQSPAGLRLLQLAVLVSAAALTVHPHKLPRNLIILAPLLSLGAFLPLAASRLSLAPTVRYLPGVLLLGLGTGYAHHQLLAPDRPRLIVYPDYNPDPLVQQVLDGLTPFARESRFLFVDGWGYSGERIPLWLHEQRSSTVVIQDWTPQMVMDHATAQGSSGGPGQPGLVSYVLITPPFPPAKDDEGVGRPELEARLAEAKVPLVATIRTPGRWVVRVYRHRRPDPEGFSVRRVSAGVPEPGQGLPAAPGGPPRPGDPAKAALAPSENRRSPGK